MTVSTTTASGAARTGRPRVVRLIGAVGLGAAVLGAVHACWLVAYPPTVAETSYSYPFGPGGFAASQVFLTVRDLGLAALVAGLLWTSVAHSRLARAGLAGGAVSMVALACLEVVSIAVGDSADLGAAYGLTSFGVGLGLTVAGTCAARRLAGPHRLRFLPLALGLYVFLVLTPGIVAGSTSGQLVICGWMSLFARLGWTLLELPAGTPRRPRAHLGGQP